ncbi:MAG TPA: hypothetical protein VHE61_20600 [Opitutaceae bacterium]|nr:hypothetical protein [Opitutaceae bacterium]
MKKRFIIGFSALVFLLIGVVSRAAPPTMPAPAQPVLKVIFVDSLHREPSANDTFNRLAYQFGRVFDQRQWPVKVEFERFAANNGPAEQVLQIFYQGIRHEFDERVFRAWMVLDDHGTKHDFGMVVYRYSPRPLEPVDDMLDAVFHGAGEKTAALLQPYVAPGAAVPSPAR